MSTAQHTEASRGDSEDRWISQRGAVNLGATKISARGQDAYRHFEVKAMRRRSKRPRC